jgi:hypothetical protein
MLAILANYAPGHNTLVADLMDQLARDIDNNRDNSIGVEFDPECSARSSGGTDITAQIIRVHGMRKLTIPGKSQAALCLIDADADLSINRTIFGDDLRGFDLPAVRRGRVTQCKDATLAKSSIIPCANLPSNVHKAERLREKLGNFVRGLVEQGKRVLVVTNKPVRQVMTGEAGARLPTWAEWQGAEITHFGALLGVNRWEKFDAVVIIGREQMPPRAAERMARAIHANSSLTIDFQGKYIKEKRGYDLRSGQAGVSVYVHPDQRVQQFVELKRERGTAQAIDRLRLVHPDDRSPEIFIISNLPVPGIVVDHLLSLEEILSGGTCWELALNLTGGVVPLVKEWLASRLPSIFTSERTAKREIEKLKKSTRQLKPYCQVALFRTEGQRCQSKAIVRQDLENPREVLESQLGKKIVDFRFMIGTSFPE